MADSGEMLAVLPSVPVSSLFFMLASYSPCTVIFLGKLCHCKLETCCRIAPGKIGTNWLEMHVSPNINYSGSMNILHINLRKGYLSTSGLTISICDKISVNQVNQTQHRFLLSRSSEPSCLTWQQMKDNVSQ